MIQTKSIPHFLIFFVFTMFYAVAAIYDYTLLMVIVKPLPIIWLLLSMNFDKKLNKFIFIGLIFSIGGDILLDKFFNLFVFGLLSFLIAQLFYLYVFYKRNKQIKLLSSIPFYTYALIIFFILFPYLDNLAIPVSVYVLVIITMLWRAYIQRNIDAVAVFAFVGALFFVLSDSMIAINKFYIDIKFYFKCTLVHLELLLFGVPPQMLVSIPTFLKKINV